MPERWADKVLFNDLAALKNARAKDRDLRGAATRPSTGSGPCIVNKGDAQRMRAEPTVRVPVLTFRVAIAAKQLLRSVNDG